MSILGNEEKQEGLENRELEGCGLKRGWRGSRSLTSDSFV
jgi:hypothetical protein